MNRKQQYLVDYFEKFISESRRHKRNEQVGKRLSRNTVSNYSNTLRLLQEFEETQKEKWPIVQVSLRNKRMFEREKKRWNKFFKGFTNFLFDQKNCYDNYVGSQVKILKTFFAWLKEDKGVQIGDFYKKFHVWKEDIQIVVLSPEQLNYLIRDVEFETSLPAHLMVVKDIFVIGCTVGLRVSDLLNLKKSNVEIVDETHYLAVRSKKTHVYTRVKLPDYLIDILGRNKVRGPRLLPKISSAHLNRQIKELIRLANWDHAVIKTRTKRGVPVEVYKDKTKRTHYKFSDLVSTHTMRRTAITTMLRLGMEETMVRKISGHSPGSVEFYRYVKLSQQSLDQQVDMVFDKLYGHMTT